MHTIVSSEGINAARNHEVQDRVLPVASRTRLRPMTLAPVAVMNSMVVVELANMQARGMLSPPRSPFFAPRASQRLSTIGAKVELRAPAEGMNADDTVVVRHSA